MFATKTIAGDASGGLVSLVLTPERGFIWLIAVMSIRYGLDGTARDFRMEIDPGNGEFYGVSAVTNGSAAIVSLLDYIPRALPFWASGDNELVLRWAVENVDTITTKYSARAVRWQAGAPQPNWVTFFSGPR